MPLHPAQKCENLHDGPLQQSSFWKPKQVCLSPTLRIRRFLSRGVLSHTLKSCLRSSRWPGGLRFLFFSELRFLCFLPVPHGSHQETLELVQSSALSRASPKRDGTSAKAYQKTRRVSLGEFGRQGRHVPGGVFLSMDSSWSSQMTPRPTFLMPSSPVGLEGAEEVEEGGPRHFQGPVEAALARGGGLALVNAFPRGLSHTPTILESCKRVLTSESSANMLLTKRASSLSVEIPLSVPLSERASCSSVTTSLTSPRTSSSLTAEKDATNMRAPDAAHAWPRLPRPTLDTIDPERVRLKAESKDTDSTARIWASRVHARSLPFLAPFPAFDTTGDEDLSLQAKVFHETDGPENQERKRRGEPLLARGSKDDEADNASPWNMSKT